MNQEPKGGFAGMLLKFGDGPGPDTLQLMFGGWTLGLTLHDGRAFDAYEPVFGYAEEAWYGPGLPVPLEAVSFIDENGFPHTVPIADIVVITVY